MIGVSRLLAVLRSFQFIPLGSPLPALLARPRWENAEFLFDISSEPDRRYQVQMSTNLFSWQTLVTLLATNAVMTFATDSGPATGPRFYRAITCP